MTQNMYMYTESEPFTDRVWIPTLAMQRERLGGVAYYRNYMWPGHAVSWEETNGEIAALVTAARPDYLRITVFNAGALARRTMLRVWQLEIGRYEMKVQDGGATVLSLKRHSRVALEVPSRKQLAVEFRQVEKGRPLAELPDLAIAAEEVRYDRGLEIPVHNIGAVASRPFTVVVKDEAGRVLAEQRHGDLEAPVDLKPKIAVVRFPGIAVRPGLTLDVRQDGGEEEITEENNHAVVPPIRHAAPQ
jgi:hypothetical protein